MKKDKTQPIIELDYPKQLVVGLYWELFFPNIELRTIYLN